MNLVTSPDLALLWRSVLDVFPRKYILLHLVIDPNVFWHIQAQTTCMFQNEPHIASEFVHISITIIHSPQSRLVYLPRSCTDWKSSPCLTILSTHFLATERGRTRLEAITTCNKCFKELSRISEPRRCQCRHSCYCWGAGHWGIVADHTEDELHLPAEPAEQMCTILLLGTKMPLNCSLALE